MANWYTSDEHYGHAPIIDFCRRPFVSLPEMDAMLIRLHNRLVKPGDDVYHIGDFALGEFENVPRILRELHGRHHLVCGNHDRPWGRKRKAERARRDYLLAGFASVYDQMHLTIGPHHVFASHLPLDDGDRLPRLNDKYVDIRPGRNDLHGAVAQIHGHVHGAWKVLGIRINVGVDVRGFEPVSEAALLAEIDEIVGAKVENSLATRNTKA